MAKRTLEKETKRLNTRFLRSHRDRRVPDSSCFLCAGSAMRHSGGNMEQAVLHNLKILWDYMRMNMDLSPADCIIGFGSYDDAVAARSAELYLADYAPRVLFSGGLGRNTRERWSVSEAKRFASVAAAAGVPSKDILIEDKSTNTGENILFARKLLEERQVNVTRIIGVHKPYMERRIFAALRVYWPEVEVLVTSPQQTLEAHLRSAVAQGLDDKTVIDVIVGDFQRIDVYARRGYQIPQQIPAEAGEAFQQLVQLGYTDQLI